MKTYLLAAACVAATSGVAWSQPAPPPASAFGAPAAVSEIAISPDGAHVAIAGPVDGQVVLSIATIDSPEIPRLALGDVEMETLRWLGSDYVLATVSFWMDKTRTSEVEIKAARLRRTIAVTPQARLASTLLEGDPSSQMLLNLDVVGVTPEPSPKALMVGRTGGALGRLGTPVLWRVDPATGQGTVVETGDATTLNWGFDLDGEARIRLNRIADGDFTLSSRPKGGADWQVVWTSHGIEDRRGYHGYSAPDDALILSRPSGGGYEVVLKGLDGQAERTVGKPKALRPFFLWDEWRLTMAGLLEYADHPTYEWLEPEPAAAYAALSRAFKGQWVRITDWSKDRKRFVVGLGSPDMPTSWRLYDQPTHQLSPLAEDYPQLAGAKMGVTRWVSFRARDGLQLGAYVTTPPEHLPGQRTPLVVLPHDGPGARDDFSFDYMTQFLATRGYTVLRPQYRGTRNFGVALEAAGEGEWVTGMQTDLLDGVAALQAEGEIDPKSVCIVGDTFGGYLALSGATMHPEAYRCAVSISGIADIPELIGHPGATSASRAVVGWWSKLKKHPPEELAKMSPTRHADAAVGSILLIVAGEDKVAPIHQSELMKVALQKVGGKVEYRVIAGADHDFATTATRTQMLETLGAFLAKNLPVAR